MRSMLFVPGNSPAMLLNADVHGADGIILDLEDAVSPDQKDAARILVRNALRALKYNKTTVIVRVNPVDTPYFMDDIRAIAPLAPDYIMPTKVNDKNCALEVVRALTDCSCDERTSVMPLIESAQGIENAYEIACSHPRVRALLLGAEDYSADIRAKRSKAGFEIQYARGRIINAARAAGIDVYDTPFTDVNDSEGIVADASLARDMGFTGKASISPRHIEAINTAFTPTLAEIEYSEEVLAAVAEGKRLAKGAVSLRGKMIDKPVADRARRLLELARSLGLEATEI